MTISAQILGEFIDAWNAGRRPDLAAFLERAPESERDHLAAELAAWLEIAPTPRFDEATRSQIAQEPALKAALAAAAAQRAPLAARLSALRQRAGLSVPDVAQRLVAAFDLDDRERAAERLECIESGDLDPTRLSRRLLDALAKILGADLQQLRPGPATAQTFFRADEDADQWIAGDIDVLSRAALASAPEPMDELDRLFFGGPDA